MIMNSQQMVTHGLKQQPQGESSAPEQQERINTLAA
jgi:hypothetical protein